MKRSARRIRIAMAAVLAVAPTLVWGQAYPAKPLRLIVPLAAGSRYYRIILAP